MCPMMAPLTGEAAGRGPQRKGRVDKDVRRTDRATEFFAGSHNDNVERLRHVLLSYVMYNFDLGYCQVRFLRDLPKPYIV